MSTPPSKTVPVILTVGIGSEATYKRQYPDTDNPPALWFDSLSNFARLMSTANLTLLSMIRAHHPTAVLKLPERHGLIGLSRGERYNVVAEVAFDEIRVLVILDT